MFGPVCPPSCFLTKCFDPLFVTYVASHTVPPPTHTHSYNAIKSYTKEGRQTELSATEHLVSAAEAGKFR